MSNTKWTNEFLDNMRQTGDDLADKAAYVLWKNQDRPIVDDLVYISKNHEKGFQNAVNHIHGQLDLTEAEYDIIANYFKESEKIEEQVTEEDIENFRINAEVFENYGYYLTFLLFFKSLPTGYMCPNPAEVLHNTKLLEKFAARRVMETAQYVFAVNRADWYKKHSPGMEAIQKVRLMHAGMRVALLRGYKDRPPWDLKMGKPINQEDIALTNHLFCLAIIQGLDMIGVHLTQRERHAVFHTWQWIGHAMGIKKELFVEDYNEGWRQFNIIFERGKSTNNPPGPPLTRALLTAMDTIIDKDIDINVLEDVTLYLLNNKDTAKSLGLHHPSLMDRVMNRVLHGVLGWGPWQRLFHHKRTNWLAKWVNKMADRLIIKNFGLEGYRKKYPGSDPLEAFSKSVLQELSQRDMLSFERMTEEQRKKSFLMPSELYMSWDLGSFNLNVDEKAA